MFISTSRNHRKGNVADLDIGSAMEPMVAMIPFPAHGHVNPLMRLAYTLAVRGIRITVFCSERYVRSAEAARHRSHLGLIQIVPIEGGTLPESTKGLGNANAVRAMEIAAATMEEPFELLLRETMAKWRVSCIITDVLLGWTQSVADRVELPRIALWSSNTAACVVYASTEKLIHEGYLPVQAKLRQKGNIVVEGLPGLGNIHLRDIPFSFYGENDGDHNTSQFEGRVNVVRRLREAACVVANTFEELEEEAIAGVRSLFPNFWPVGPLLPAPTEDVEEDEKEECLQWLDKQAPGSVVYASFGSMANLLPEQVRELARGLESSGAPFLWAVRKDLVQGSGVTGAWVEDFLTRTKERGRVTEWAPQVQVLRHPSVAVFLTHCGWNSSMEAICSGVPLLGWPCFAEQNLNCKLIEEQWRIGAAIREMQSSEIVCKIRLVMADEEIRKNASRWRSASRTSSSQATNLEKMISTFIQK